MDSWEDSRAHYCSDGITPPLTVEIAIVHALQTGPTPDNSSTTGCYSGICDPPAYNDNASYNDGAYFSSPALSRHFPDDDPSVNSPAPDYSDNNSPRHIPTPALSIDNSVFNDDSPSSSDYSYSSDSSDSRPSA